MALKTVATFHDPVEADIVAAKLKASGIDAHVSKETYQTLFPGQFPWNIRVQVLEDQVNEALEILVVEAPQEKTIAKKTCPKCNSTDVRSSLLRKALMTVMSLGVAQVFPLKVHQCENCRHRF